MTHGFKQFLSWCAVGCVAAAWISVSAAENPYRLKPGAAGKLCLECHVTFEETLKLSSVHSPVAGGDCAGCHDPHASSHGKLLSAAPSGICGECHEGVLPDAPRSAHPDVVSGACTACHDPHASEHEKVLVREGSALCGGCHEELVEAIGRVRFAHPPVEDGCMNCHDAHASADSPALLRTDTPGLCLDCHDATRESFTKQHLGYPVGKADCSSCHDPHGSDEGGMLWETVHRPITTKMCGQCHNGPAATSPLALKKTGADGCRGCHSQMLNKMAAASRLHWAVVDGDACLNCHSPHASKHSGLLLADMKTLCGSCHEDTLARQENVSSQHAPVRDGECSTCHDPHAANQSFMLAGENNIELCGNCHDWKGHSSHPIGEDVVDPRNPNLTLDCSSCHFAHGSEHKYLGSFSTERDLCVECHDSMRR